MAKLSRRMQAAASLVTTGYRLADVGTDHGYVPISLVQEGRVPFAYAMDINKGPLEKASANIRREGLDDKIKTILGDGLAGLNPQDVDSILIAGMGGELVIHILTEGYAVSEAARELILQPQSDIRKVRAYIRSRGFQITEEEMILEDGKYYPMMRAVKLGTGVQFSENKLNCEKNTNNIIKISENRTACNPETSEYTAVCDIYGPVLLQKKHPVLLSFLEKEHITLQNILKSFEGKTETDNLVRSRRDIEQKLQYNEAAMYMMKQPCL